MHQTSTYFLPKPVPRSFFPRNSLENISYKQMNKTTSVDFNNMKNKMRKSMSSLDGYKKHKQSQIQKVQKVQKIQLPILLNNNDNKQKQRIEQSLHNNIYFNQKSRNNYFKNIIDSYFDKKQIPTDVLNKQQKISHILRRGYKRNTINFKKQQNQKQHIVNKNINIKQLQSQDNNKNKLANLININKIKNYSQVQRYDQKSQNKNQRRSKPKINQFQLNNSNNNNNNKDIDSYKQFKSLSSSQVFISQNQFHSDQLQQYNQKQLHCNSILRKITQLADDCFQQQQQQKLMNSTMLTNFSNNPTGSYINSHINHHNNFNNNNNHHNNFNNSNDNLNLSSSQFSQLSMLSQVVNNRIQQNKRLKYQNEIIRIYQSFSQQNKKKYIIKQFKQPIFLDHHMRAIEQGILNIWQQYKFNQLSLIRPSTPPFLHQLFKFTPHPTTPNLIYITRKSLHKNLLANNCQQLFILFKQFILKSQKYFNKNMCYMNGQLIVSEWQYSSIKHENNIQDKYFQHRIHPILKSQYNYFVNIEQLSPEILQSIIYPNKQFNLYKQNNISDIYSIAIAFLTIIISLPMWMSSNCIIKGKIYSNNNRNNKPRNGLLAVQKRNINKIIDKQKQLKNNVIKLIQRQLQENQKNYQFFSLLFKMIQFYPENRITYQQILTYIKNK